MDSIKTPHAENLGRLLAGGSASHAAVAASFCAGQTAGIVGEDFPKKYIKRTRSTALTSKACKQSGQNAFHWSGEYEVNMNNRRTLVTELGVFETFTPKLPASYRHQKFVLLANIAPSLQSHVLTQMSRPKFVVATR